MALLYSTIKYSCMQTRFVGSLGTEVVRNDENAKSGKSVIGYLQLSSHKTGTTLKITALVTSVFCAADLFNNVLKGIDRSWALQY